MKLEDILRAQGYTDADIAALQPMLADQRFRDSLEKQFGAVTTERDQLKDLDGKWQERLDTEWQPRVTQMERDLAATRLELATANERIKIAKDFGYIDEQKVAEAEAAAATAKLQNNGGFDPKNYVSMDDAQKMLEAEGRAIAMAADINNEYTKLTGQSLYDYETEIDGRRMRGLTALREEAKAKRVNLDQYVAKKFDFQSKREAIRAKADSEKEAAIRRDEAEKVRTELASQYGNPNMRTAVPSRVPFFEKKADGKQPWEVPAQQLQQNRIDRAMKTQLTGKPS